MDRFAEHRDRLDPPGAAAHVPGGGNARRLEVLLLVSYSCCIRIYSTLLYIYESSYES